jgi:sugar lactone lactonase YvrE
MAYARQRNWDRMGPAAIAVSALVIGLAAPGCDGDEPTGAAGTAGASNPGGTAGTAGTAAGTAGTAGAGGTQGGTAGMAGTAGTAGTMTAACNPNVGVITPGKALDVTPDSKGTTVYFTASGPQGPSVFSAPAGGGSSKELYAGDPLVAPLGITIANDDKHLYIADPGYETDANDPKTKVGQIFSMVPAGGEPVAVAGSEGTRPRGLDIGDDAGTETIFFTGVDSMDSKPGVFKVPANGGALAPVAKGNPFVDPSGIAVGKTAIFVTDAVASETKISRVFIVEAGSPSIFLAEVGLGYPAGVALSLDEKTLFLSGINPDTGFNELHVVDIAKKTTTIFNGNNVEKNRDAAGLHRARTTDFFSWADFGANKGEGSVFSITCN